MLGSTFQVRDLGLSFAGISIGLRRFHTVRMKRRNYEIFPFEERFFSLMKGRKTGVCFKWYKLARGKRTS